MHTRLLITGLVGALTFALPAFASEVTGTLTAGQNSTTSSSQSGSLSGTVATSSGGSLSGSVVAPTTTSSGGSGSVTNGAISPVYTGTSGTSTTNPLPGSSGSVLGASTSSTPKLPNTGAGGSWPVTMLVMFISAATTVFGGAYLRQRA